MGTPKIGLSYFFLNIWWPFIWGGHPPFISLVISPVYPWLRAPHMCPRLEAAVVKNFAVKCGKHVGVSIHMGTPLSLDGWFPRENPWINGWWWLGGTPHDLGNLHLKLTILVIKKNGSSKPKRWRGSLKVLRSDHPRIAENFGRFSPQIASDLGVTVEVFFNHRSWDMLPL